MKFVAFSFYTTGQSASNDAVLQSPADVIKYTGESIQLLCSHGSSSYNTILWYFQEKGEQTLQLLGYLYHKVQTLEEAYEKRHKMTGDGKTSGSLEISELSLKDSAVYFCAASEHSTAVPL